MHPGILFEDESMLAYIVRRWVSPDCRDPLDRAANCSSSFYAEIHASMCVQQVTNIIDVNSVLITWINNFINVNIIVY